MIRQGTAPGPFRRVVRFYSERTSSESAVQLEKTNEQLFYNNRHDGLTGLRNRKALEEDVQKIVKDHDELYKLISQADEKLYEVKERTHVGK